MTAECLLCHHTEPDHGPAGSDDTRCRFRRYHGPGRFDYDPCECPGYEGDNDNADPA